MRAWAAERTRVGGGAALRFATLLGLGLLVLLGLAWLNRGDLPGLRHAIREAPAALGISALVHVPQILLTALAWRVLIGARPRPGMWLMVRVRWFRESLDSLLPAGALFGQALAARLLTRRGLPAHTAAATATVDLTIETMTQLLFTLAGLGLLLAGRDRHGMATAATGSFALGLLAAAAMVLVQRRLPLARLRAFLRPFARRWSDATIDRIEEAQQAIRQLHTQWRALLLASLCHTTSWVLGSLEIVGVLSLLGRNVSVADGLVVESIAQALRSAGFALPGAVGLQEGAIIGACALVGVAPVPALVLALVRRARGLIIGVTGVLLYRSGIRGEIE